MSHYWAVASIFVGAPWHIALHLHARIYTSTFQSILLQNRSQMQLGDISIAMQISCDYKFGEVYICRILLKKSHENLAIFHWICSRMHRTRPFPAATRYDLIKNATENTTCKFHAGPKRVLERIDSALVLGGNKTNRVSRWRATRSNFRTSVFF